ncbi:hypothetical protein [Methylobacterium sp. Gmos1]
MTMDRHEASKRYAALLATAEADATDNLAAILPPESVVEPITGVTLSAWELQWRPVSTRRPPEGGWDWPSIWTDRRRRHKELFHCAVWTGGDRLVGLALGVPNKTAVVLEGVEGDPRGDNPASGLVLIAIIEAAACYARLTNRSEIWAREPSNQRLVDLYVERFTFEPVSRKGYPFYCRKRL